MKHYMHIVCQSMSFLLPLSDIDHILAKGSDIEDKIPYSLSQLLQLKQVNEEYIILFVDSPIALYTEEIKDICMLKDADILAIHHPLLLHKVPFIRGITTWQSVLTYVLDMEMLLTIRGQERKENT